jgi:hypothetical protein
MKIHLSLWHHKQLDASRYGTLCKQLNFKDKLEQRIDFVWSNTSREVLYNDIIDQVLPKLIEVIEFLCLTSSRFFWLLHWLFPQLETKPLLQLPHNVHWECWPLGDVIQPDYIKRQRLNLLARPYFCAKNLGFRARLWQ